ncbi:MAG TPA: YbdD/YjiX family protein [Casimicrobiaceae bacterium]
MNAAAINHSEQDWRARVRRAYLQVFGIPDYARYLDHMGAHHPGAPVLCERAFHAQAIDRKYSKRGARCC